MAPRRRVRYALAGLAIVLVVALGFWFWFQPSGIGEYGHSPDGRFEAHAMNMTRPTLGGGQEQWIEIWVIEVVTGREVWRVVHRHPPGADVPSYGARGAKFIEWAPDSSAVTIPVAGGQPMTLTIR